MAQTQMSELIRASLDGVRSFTGADTFIGEPIEARGVTVIPVSRVSIAFATGGVDYGAKKIIAPQSFGGGGGTGVTITPIAFLTVHEDARVELIPIEERGVDAAVGKVASLVEKAPELLQKIKQVLF